MMVARLFVFVLAFQSALGQRQVVDVHLEEAVGGSAHGFEERSMRQGQLRTASSADTRQALDGMLTGWNAQSMQIARLHRSVEAPK